MIYHASRFLLVFIAATAYAWSQDSRIVVRLAPGSPTAQRWLSNKSNTIAGFFPLLGAHSVESFLLDETLFALQGNPKWPVPTSNNKITALVDNLARTLVVVCNIPPEKALRTLRTHADVDTAEVQVVYTLADVPNDPLVEASYHHNRIRTFEAWQFVPPSAAPIVAIIDTGIELTHPDLQGALWTNAGEIGTDGIGRDRRTNGLDDDGNGFVDDWAGWDFVGVNGRGDNSPTPGNAHGTHVAGIVGAVANNGIGGAGVAPFARLMALKVAQDDPASRNVTRVADAVIYAVLQGTAVINCSFGAPAMQFADADAFRIASEMGVVVVGASGNGGADVPLFPAAFPASISVGATNAADDLADFSNIHSTVSVCAPGESIISTLLQRSYGSESGTSMSAPIVAATAAMVRQRFPSYTPAQVKARIQATAASITPTRPRSNGLYGSGRVDALRALSAPSARWCSTEDARVTVSDTESFVSVSVINQLDPLSTGRLSLSAFVAETKVYDNATAAVFGSLATRQRIDIGPLLLPLPSIVDGKFDIPIVVFIDVFDGNDRVGGTLVRATLNPSWRTISENNIALTLTGSGNLGYSDFPNNEEGQGCRYRGSPSLLYEGALMIGTSAVRLSNAARSVPSDQKDSSFTLIGPIEVTAGPGPEGIRADVRFDDSTEPQGVGVSVQTTAYQSPADSLRNIVILDVAVKNSGRQPLQNLCLAYFFDWDVSAAGQQDGSAWLNKEGVAVVESVADAESPMVGISMVSPLPLIVNIVDNDSRLANEPGVYGGFPRSTKWYMMSRGIARTRSRVTDVSMVFGAGPIDLAADSTVHMVLVLGIAPNFDDVMTAVRAGRNRAMDLGLNAVTWQPLPNTSQLLSIEGGTVLRPGSSTRVSYEVDRTSTLRAEFIDLMGRTIAIVAWAEGIPAGTYSFDFQVPDVPTGPYAIRMISPSSTSLVPVLVHP